MRFETLLDELDADAANDTGTGKLALPGLSPEDIESLKLQGNPVAALAGETSSKSYLTLHKHRNVQSNSILEALHACPRLFIQQKLEANLPSAVAMPEQPNVDFVFGHSVGSGIQTYIAFDNNLPYALYAAFLSWTKKWDLGREDWNEKKKKNIERAMIAVEMFSYWWTANMADEWEVYRLEDGSPAVELSFCIDFGKSKYFGHIDIILRNKRTGKIAIGENKTSGFTNINPALFQNAGQALGYSLVLDKVVGHLADYDVMYFVYSVKSEEWHFLPFAKSTSQKLEWIQDRLIDAGHVQQYFQMQHFPKDGRSCIQFNRTCKYFGTCDLVDKEAMQQLPVLDDVDSNYPVNYHFSVDEIINRQVENVA